MNAWSVFSFYRVCFALLIVGISTLCSSKENINVHFIISFIIYFFFFTHTASKRSHSCNSFCFVLGFFSFIFFYIFYERGSQSLLGSVLLKRLGWKVILVIGSRMKGKGREWCGHSQQDGNTMEKCGWVYGSMQGCLFVCRWVFACTGSWLVYM